MPGKEPLLLMMTVHVVDNDSDDPKYSQFTTVPFKWSLTGPISNVDSTGKLSLADVLEKLNTVELTTNSDIAALAESEETKICKTSVAVISFSKKKKPTKSPLQMAPCRGTCQLQLTSTAHWSSLRRRHSGHCT